MPVTIVTTQAELDAAIAVAEADQRGYHEIEIRSEAGVWLNLAKTPGSATVSAWDSATVSASGSATVSAWDSATVRASGSATVRAWDSATVRAWDSATVRASDSATVSASGSATVSASPKVAVHLHSAKATVQGGVVIDVSKPLTDAREWCEHHGVKVSKAGIATVFKAVNDQWTTDRGIDYSPGSKPKSPDWRDDDSCGGGLHFGPSPHHSHLYYAAATRYVAVGVKVDNLRVITGGAPKCKVAKVVRACVEVDLNGNPIESAVTK